MQSEKTVFRSHHMMAPEYLRSVFYLTVSVVMNKMGCLLPVTFEQTSMHCRWSQFHSIGHEVCRPWSISCIIPDSGSQLVYVCGLKPVQLRSYLQTQYMLSYELMHCVIHVCELCCAPANLLVCIKILFNLFQGLKLAKKALY